MTEPSDLEHVDTIAPVENDGAARQERLSRSTIGLGRASIPIDRWFRVGSGALIGLGLLIIVLGWYGAAHTTRVWEQTPYLLSGGLLGTALVFAGGFGYFAQWLTRLTETGRQQVEALARIEQLLRDRESDSAAPAADTLVVTANGSMIHRADCSMVRGKDVSVVSGGTQGYRPCLMCQPFELGRQNGTPTPSSASTT